MRPGDPVADKILEALRRDQNGLTRSEISDLFGRHRSAERIDQALAILAGRGLVEKTKDVSTGGRYASLWILQ